MSVRSRSNWNLEVLVFGERGKPEYPEKNLSEQGREPTTQPTYGVDVGIWTRATLVGGERSHHCATLAPQKDRLKKMDTVDSGGFRPSEKGGPGHPDPPKGGGPPGSSPRSAAGRTPLTRTKSHFPWISPHFSVIFILLSRIGQLEFPANLSYIFFPLIRKSLKMTPMIRILVLVTLLGCHSISSSCCIISKNTKANTG